MKNLVIFDLDGTILNTLEDLADSCNHILTKFGMPTRTIEEIRNFVGNGVPKLIERAFPQNTSKEIISAALTDFIEYYENHSCIKTRPYEGIITLLKKLKNDGIFLAVNTNKIDEAAQILCEKFYPGIFDFVLGSSKDLPTKPAPNGVYQIMKYIEETELFQKSDEQSNQKLDLKDVFFVGDSDVDIQTGRNAGVGTTIGVAWGFRGREFLLEHGAHLVAENPEELYKIIIEKI